MVEIKDSGLLWYTNLFLHAEQDDDENIIA